MATTSSAFNTLTQHDFVIGPAQDEGYYLLGMKALYPLIFQNKKWSTTSVLKDTIRDIIKLNKRYCVLPTLMDIDSIEDLKTLASDPIMLGRANKRYN